jgi:hypothetical protein
MRKPLILVLSSLALLLLPSCSPRDFLTRRLAADLIARSETFRVPRQLLLRTGVISNDDYLSPESLALQHRGWISGTRTSCPLSLVPPPCWQVILTPSGVDTFHTLVVPGDADKTSFSIPAARRELVAVTGIAKQGNVADVEFSWRWVALNEVGAAVFPSDLRYRSTASFRWYDDGWRVVGRSSSSHRGQPLDEALKNAEPAQ